MSDKIVHLLIGIPGSGKSTIAKKLVEEHNAVYLSADAIREEILGDTSDNTQNAKVFATLYDRLNDAFISQQTVVIDNTNYNRKNRKTILAMAKEAEYLVYAYEMSIPHEVSRERNKNRDRVVPDNVMHRMIDGYQKPDPNTEYIHKVISV